MTSRKIIAVFESHDDVQNARDSLLELGFQRDQIFITDRRSREHTLRTPGADGSFWAHVKEMFMPERDRHTIEESIRRGNYVLVADVDEGRVNEAVERLEQSGAVDLDEREGQPVATDPAINRPDRERTNTDEAVAAESAGSRVPNRNAGGTIPVIEERLHIGKREVNRGSVRVRSYIVEEPVHEEVRLREERVTVERRPVNAPAPVTKGSPEDLFQERTIEMTETAEQAVVGKEARVTEEVVVSKTAIERTERVDDIVRHTDVHVEDNRDVEAGRGPYAE